MAQKDRGWDKTRQWQFDELTQLLTDVWSKSKLYRGKFEATGIELGDIRSWDDFSTGVPFIDKAMVIEDQSLNEPFGNLVTIDQKDIKYIFCYAGPELVVYDDKDWLEGLKITAQYAPYREVGKDDVVNVTMSFHWVDAGFIQYATYMSRGAAVIPAGSGDSEKQIEIMRLTKATVISGFPTFIDRLAEKSKEMGVNPRTDLSIRLAIVAGEMWSAAKRREIEDTFGMETRQIYGGAEVGGIAYECSCKRGMHIDPYIILEILDPDTGRPVPPGHSGEVVVTSLGKRCQPMIRFRTYDITSGLDTSPCSCGINSPRIGNIIGRTGNILRVRGLWVVPHEIEKVILRYPQLGRFQAIVDRPQTMDVLTIRIEQRQPCEVPALTTRLMQELKEQLRLTCHIEIVPPDFIPGNANVMVDKRSIDSSN
ncbi:phenylacetate--CoA ligase family protein [Chloroflexota bacterium]